MWSLLLFCHPTPLFGSFFCSFIPCFNCVRNLLCIVGAGAIQRGLARSFVEGRTTAEAQEDLGGIGKIKKRLFFFPPAACWDLARRTLTRAHRCACSRVPTTHTVSICAHKTEAHTQINISMNEHMPPHSPLHKW